MTPPIYIRIGERRRTFHTHGVPFRSSRAEFAHVRVNTWESSRRILARAYRDLRAFGLTPSQARSVTADLLLVPTLIGETS